MRILVVSNMFPDKKHPSYGVFVRNFCQQLSMLDMEYSLSVMYKSNSKIGKIINYLRFYFKTFFKCIFGKYDIVYVHYASNSSIPVLWAQKFVKNKIYTNVHGSDVVPENEKQEKLQKYTREVLAISEKIIAPSTYFKNYLVDKYGIESQKVYVVHSGGVNSDVFFKEAERNKSKDVLRLGYVGRLTHGKGWDTMIIACSQLKDINYKLLIVGSGEKEQELEKLIDSFAVRSHIKRYQLLSQEELRNIYNQIDVFIFPTEREGESLGLVAIEAMACGTPVIASNFAAPSDYIKEGQNGLKFEKGNWKDLERAIRDFHAASDDVKMKMSECAMNTADDYSVAKILNQMELVFRE